MDAARSMVERDDLPIPYYGGEPFFEKLALTYSLIAISFHTVGFTSKAARSGTSVYHVPVRAFCDSLSLQSKDTRKHRMGAYAGASAYLGRRRATRI
jgi:hypothetical protein